MRKGIFWCTSFDTEHPKLITVSVACDKNGNAKGRCSSAQNPAVILITSLNGSALKEALRRGARLTIIPEVVLK